MCTEKERKRDHPPSIKTKNKSEGSTRLTYRGTRLCGGLEHLKIESRLVDERFESVMGEYVFLK